MAPKTSSIPAQTLRRCRLLELPAELRLNIYEQLFTSHGYVLHIASEGRCKHVKGTKQIGSGILRTCRLLHREALPAFYDAINLRIVCWALGFSLNPKIGRKISDRSIVTMLKRARNVTFTVRQEDSEVVVRIIGCIDKVLKALDFGRSLRNLTIDFEFEFGICHDEAWSLLMAFNKIVCPGAVETYLALPEQGSNGVAEKYLQLVKALNALPEVDTGDTCEPAYDGLYDLSQTTEGVFDRSLAL